MIHHYDDMRASHLVCILLSLSAGCAFDGDGDGDAPLGGSLVVTGQVVDFQSGMAIDTAASVTTSGLLPAPQVTTCGAEFTIEGIPKNSAFQILASAGIEPCCRKPRVQRQVQPPSW